MKLQTLLLTVLSSGGVPAISVSPSSWDFGSTPVGTPVSKEFTIENTGTALLTIGDRSYPSGFTETVAPASTSLAPGASTTFTVQATAASVSTPSGNISIVSNAASSPTLVAIEVDVTIITNGLIAWYDATDAATLWEDSARTVPAADNADVIGAWDDKSGNGHHAIQATTGNKPTLRTNVQNGKNAIRFDGTDDFLRKTSFADFGDNYTAFIVSKHDAAGDNSQGSFEVGSGAVNSGFSLLFKTATLRNAFRGRDATSNIDAEALADTRDGNFYIREGVNSGTLISYLANGNLQNSTAYTGPNPNTLNQLDIGQINAAGFVMNGDIAELIIYNRTLSTDERTAIRNSLNTKWAVY